MRKIKNFVKVIPHKWWSLKAWRVAKKVQLLDNYLCTCLLDEEKWAMDILREARVAFEKEINEKN